eukprot:3408603-Pleurochrysis_carterae.AAC.2
MTCPSRSDAIHKIRSTPPITAPLAVRTLKAALVPSTSPSKPFIRICLLNTEVQQEDHRAPSSDMQLFPDERVRLLRACDDRLPRRRGCAHDLSLLSYRFSPQLHSRAKLRDPISSSIAPGHCGAETNTAHAAAPRARVAAGPRDSRWAERRRLPRAAQL